MDLRQFKYFAMIVECGSLSKAAERLHVAQPSLSQHISNMEAELKTPLLIRSSQGVAPTGAGKVLYRHARKVLRQIEQLRAEVLSATGAESGEVSVGLPTSIASVLAVPLFEAVREKFPGVHLQIFESMSGYLLELLGNGRLDMALLFEETESLGIATKPLLTEKLSVFGWAGCLAGRTTCSVSDLNGVPIVLPRKPNGLRVLVEQVFAKYDSILNVVADIDSLPALLAIATKGDACTILSSALQGRSGSSTALACPLIEPELCRRIALCVSTASSSSAATEAVQNLIGQLAGKMAMDGRWAGVESTSTRDTAAGP